MSTMQIMTAAVLAAVFAVSTASAQQPATQRVAGTLEKVEGNTLTIKAASGPIILKLADNALIVARIDIPFRRSMDRLIVIPGYVPPFMIALAWRVFQDYNSPAALSIVGVAFMLPRIVVTLAGGVISDRFERRWTMIFADLGRAIPVALLALISLVPAQEIVGFQVDRDRLHCHALRMH